MLDLAMPGPNGLDVLRSLVNRSNCPPVIIVTARDDVATSVQAMKYGAANYIVKPICAGRLLPIVRQALRLDGEERSRERQRAALRSRFDTLTEDERTIFLGTLSSRLNKQLAAELGSCERTVKMRRARMMRKVGLRSVPDLVRAARLLDIPVEECETRE
jgi:FixJ family two-component response regulator